MLHPGLRVRESCRGPRRVNQPVSGVPARWYRSTKKGNQPHLGIQKGDGRRCSTSTIRITTSRVNTEKGVEDTEAQPEVTHSSSQDAMPSRGANPHDGRWIMVVDGNPDSPRPCSCPPSNYNYAGASLTSTNVASRDSRLDWRAFCFPDTAAKTNTGEDSGHAAHEPT
jgi:hypothetical protein